MTGHPQYNKPIARFSPRHEYKPYYTAVLSQFIFNKRIYNVLGMRVIKISYKEVRLKIQIL